MRRFANLTVAAALGILAVAKPSWVQASPEPKVEDRGPWSRGVMAPSLGIGMSFGPDIHVLDFGLGFSYFVLDGFAVGLGVSDTVYIYREDFKEAFPGIEEETPSNVVRLIPNVQYVFLRRIAFSPYIRAGVGPVFYNRGRGVVGEWVTGVGAYIGLAPHVALSVGIDFGANFPDEKWQDAFSYMGESIRGCALVDSVCSFNVFPRIGLMAYFGGGRNRKARSKPREVQPQPKAAPASAPAVEPAPSPPAQPPSERPAPPKTPTTGEPAPGPEPALDPPESPPDPVPSGESEAAEPGAPPETADSPTGEEPKDEDASPEGSFQEPSSEPGG